MSLSCHLYVGHGPDDGAANHFAIQAAMVTAGDHCGDPLPSAG